MRRRSFAWCEIEGGAISTTLPHSGLSLSDNPKIDGLSEMQTLGSRAPDAVGGASRSKAGEKRISVVVQYISCQSGFSSLIFTRGVQRAKHDGNSELRIEDATNPGQLHDGRVLLGKASCLFERMRHLQNRKVLFVMPNDLDSDGESFRRESTRY